MGFPSAAQRQRKLARLARTADGHTATGMGKSLPAASGGPNPGPLSLTIKKLDPTGMETCVIWSLISSGTGMSGGTSANVRITENSPPKADR